jgi:hypothetical protein
MVSPGTTFKGSFLWLIVLKSIRLRLLSVVTLGLAGDGGPGVYVSLFSQGASLIWLQSARGLLPQDLFYEKRVSSFPRLVEEVDLLDLDSGIRTFGDYQGKKGQFVFVTRSPHDTYTLIVYERKGGNAPTPGGRLLVKEFKRKDDLVKFMRGLLSKPVRAFVY